MGKEDKDKLKQYTFKTNPKRGIAVPLDCAVQGEELVWSAIKAQTPLELAELFSNPKYSYLNGDVGDKMFNDALDLSERTLDTQKSLKVQDNLYFFNFINYAKNEKAITPEWADSAVQEILYSMDGKKRKEK